MNGGKWLSEELKSDMEKYIAQKLGKNLHQLSRVREKLIDYGYLASPAYGKLTFCVPYLADYVMRSDDTSSALSVVRQRRV